MGKVIEVQDICPFINKPCIQGGWNTRNQNMIHPCAFWDGDETYNGISPEEPCRIKRAINRILSNEMKDKAECPVDFPWISKKE